MLTTCAPHAAITAAWYPEPVPTSSARSPCVQLEGLDDNRDHQRLADRLPGSVDRQRPIGVGVLAIGLEHELLAGHTRHGVEHRRRPNSVLDQRRHHAITIRRGG